MSFVLQPSLRRDLGLVAWQIRYEQRAYWRKRGRGIFTFVFPLMFLVIFASLNKTGHLSTRGGIPYDDFFVPGILAYAVIATTFVNMAISTAILRDEGILKRMQGTPLPRWAYVAARIGSTIVIVAGMTVLMLGLGAILYGVHVRTASLPGLIVILGLGTAAFTSLGIGITRFMPNAESAPVFVNLAILPLTFISSIWFPNDNMPSWLQDIAKLFPIRALADGLQYVFDPRRGGPGLNGQDVRTLLIWTAIGVFLIDSLPTQTARRHGMNERRAIRMGRTPRERRLIRLGGPFRPGGLLAPQNPLRFGGALRSGHHANGVRIAASSVWLLFILFPLAPTRSAAGARSCPGV